MTTETSSTSIPAAWLKRLPEGYAIPIWRWLLLPATAIMLKRQGGVWISGTLTLAGEELRFSQNKLIKSSRVPPEAWTLSLADITDVVLAKGFASETLEIHAPAGVVKLMTARSAEFVDKVKQAIADAKGDELP